MRAVVLSAIIVAAVACGSDPPDARENEIANVLARADEPLIRTRPALEEGKLATMALSATDYFRGTLPLYRHDLRDGTTDAGMSRFALDAPLVPSLGDAHVENFGTLRAADESLSLEANDFDGSDRAPFLWDVRRLCTGLAIAASLANEGDAEARAISANAKRAIARAAAESYAGAIIAAANGQVLGRIVEDGGNPILEDAFSRSVRDRASRRELGELTKLEGGARRLVRGVVDPTDPQGVLSELPASARDALARTLTDYAGGLASPPPASDLTILDAVREFGGGVASFPRVRALVLVRGPSDAPEDDVILEVKELADSGIAGLYPPGRYWNTVQSRVMGMAHLAWASPNTAPLWGTSTLLGLPVQVREESEGQKTLRISRMVEERGTVEALTGLATVLGQLVARVHASGPDGAANARAIAIRIGADPGGFADEQADAGASYADLALADHARFLRALHRLGPRLGIPFDAADAPSPDFAALLGTPPSPPALPSP